MEPLPCNRCGVCCTHGGSCELRRIHPIASTQFDGRCEFLTDNEDGTTTCEQMRHAEGQAWLVRLVDGNCDFPDDRTEVVTAADCEGYRGPDNLGR